MRASFSCFCTIFVFMKEMVENKDIPKDFERVAGVVPPKGFGEPFISAFSVLYGGEKNEVLAASYICSLFLSAILLGFPTEKLHTYVHYVQENHTRFAFNCKMYDIIYAHMKEEALAAVTLLDADSRAVPRRCLKEDVFEALDFYTNR